MDPSAHHHHQEMFGNYRTMEAMAASRNSSPNPHQPSSDQLESAHQKKPKPQPEQALKCPRCDSINTKFCYYNNYSLSQPRYFCKSCRRYWTKGGTLRNIPVGGGCRKNRRSSSSASSSSSSARIRAPDQSNDMKLIPTLSGSFCGYNSDQIDLGLAFALLHKQPPPGHLGFHDEHSSFENSSVDDVLRNSTSGAFGVSHQNMGLENAGYATGSAGGMDEMGSEPNKVLLGFPWQMNGESYGMNFGVLDLMDSGRESWNNNGLMSSSWHGLLNTSPLI